MTDPIALQARNEALEEQLRIARERVSELERMDTMVPPAPDDTARHQHDAHIAKSYLLAEDLLRYLSGVVDGTKVDIAQLQSFEARTTATLGDLVSMVIEQSRQIRMLNTNMELIVSHVRKQQHTDSVLPRLELVKDAE